MSGSHRGLLQRPDPETFAQFHDASPYDVAHVTAPNGPNKNAHFRVLPSSLLDLVDELCSVTPHQVFKQPCRDVGELLIGKFRGPRNFEEAPALVWGGPHLRNRAECLVILIDIGAHEGAELVVGAFHSHVAMAGLSRFHEGILAHRADVRL